MHVGIQNIFKKGYLLVLKVVYLYIRYSVNLYNYLFQSYKKIKILPLIRYGMLLNNCYVIYKSIEVLNLYKRKIKAMMNIILQKESLYL